MISLPDALLARVDARAQEHSRTRSAELRALAEAALGERQRQLAARMIELQDGAAGHGGQVAEAVKSGRPA
jgi:metal-responsive CopG/Arc/MetJ family transcriptional regulator